MALLVRRRRRRLTQPTEIQSIILSSEEHRLPVVATLDQMQRHILHEMLPQPRHHHSSRKERISLCPRFLFVQLEADLLRLGFFSTMLPGSI
jgi:hypothetical protein